LGKDTRRFEVNMKVHEKMLQNFMLAVSEGNMEDLIGLLKEDIQLFADGGGNAFIINGQRLSATPKPIEGREHVTKLLLTVVPKFYQHMPDFSQAVTFANGLPSVISYSGTSPVSLVSLEPEGGQVKNIYVQTNPDKLKHLKK
jgi:RNA polymerase sigma-70 factor (ECF subfamily)